MTTYPRCIETFQQKQAVSETCFRNESRSLDKFTAFKKQREEKRFSFQLLWINYTVMIGYIAMVTTSSNGKSLRQLNLQFKVPSNRNSEQ